MEKGTSCEVPFGYVTFDAADYTIAAVMMAIL